MKRRDKITLAVILLNLAICVYGIAYVPPERGLATTAATLWALLAIGMLIPRLRRHLTPWRR